MKFNYDLEERELNIDFKWNDYNGEYLSRLRDEFNLEDLIKDCSCDFEKVRAITNWVNQLWEHDSWNTPEKNDPLSILCEVKEGKRLRCVEYATVISGCLNALGIRARLLTLLTEDLETRESGAAHAVLEAYLKDYDKWIFIDGQFNAIPIIEEKPITVFEFGNALNENNKNLDVFINGKTKKEDYLKWIEQYLCYFSTPIDNRYDVSNSRKEIMLLPKGTKEPKVFQRKIPLNFATFTNSFRDFYPEKMK